MATHSKTTEPPIQKKLAIAAWVSPQLYAAIARIAKSARRSLSYIVCDALEQYSERYRRDETLKDDIFVDALDRTKKS